MKILKQRMQNKNERWISEALRFSALIENRLRYDKHTTGLILSDKKPTGLDETAAAMFPNVRKPKSGKYPKYDKGAHEFSGSSKRAIGDSKVKKVDLPAATMVDYLLDEYALWDLIDRQIEGRSGVLTDLVENNRTKKGKLIKYFLDQELTDNRYNAAIAIGASYKSVPAIKWDQAGANPPKDLQTIREAIKTTCGFVPNHLSIPDTVFSNMLTACRVIYNMTTGEPSKYVVERLMMEDLRIPVENLHIPALTKYSVSGDNYSDWWGARVFMWFSNPVPDSEGLTFGVTLVPDDRSDFIQLAPYEAPHKTGTAVQALREYKVFLACERAGHMLYDVLT